MKQPPSARFYFFWGLSELLIGLGVSVYIGLKISWTFALFIALSFFVSANALFFLALKRN